MQDCISIQFINSIFSLTIRSIIFMLLDNKMSDEINNFKITSEILAILRKCDPDIKPEILNLNSLEDVWVYLKKEEQKVDEKLSVSITNNSDLHDHMEQLHKYNEMKDITQEVLGQLANRLNISVTEAHRKFELHDL